MLLRGMEEIMCFFFKIPSGAVPPLKEQPSAMKRDISRIFTVPEEREVEVDQTENSTVSSVHRSVGASISPSDSAVAAQLSSMCTTPTKEAYLSKVLHGEALSICSKTNSDEVEAQTLTANDKADLAVPSKVQDVMNLDTSQSEKLKKRRSKASDFIMNCRKSGIHSLSLNDLQQNSRLASSRVPMRCYSFGLPKLTEDMTNGSGDYSPTNSMPSGRHFYNTLCDPLHPVFRYDGLPVSRSLYNETLARHYQLLDMERSDDSSPRADTISFSTHHLATSVTKKSDTKTEKDDITNSTVLNPGQNCGKCINDDTEFCSNENEHAPPQQMGQIGMTPSKQEVYRRSLSLPLKTMITNDYENGDIRERSTSYTAGVLESPAVKTRNMGLPITPLMSKLSSLAIEEKTSGFCSRDTTPGEFRDLSFPANSDNSSVPEISRRKVISEKRETELEQEEGSECTEAAISAVLYLFGHHNMSLFLLLEETLGQDPQLMHCLVSTLELQYDCSVVGLLTSTFTFFQEDRCSQKGSYAELHQEVSLLRRLCIIN
jgi:hypothetical protein